MKPLAYTIAIMLGSIPSMATPAEDATRPVTFEELEAAGFDVPFYFTDKVKLTKGLLQQAQAEIAAQQRINELLAGVHDRASADAAAIEIKQLRAVFTVGEQADILALFILECYPAAVNMVYAYEDLKIKVKEANYHGSAALEEILQ